MIPKSSCSCDLYSSTVSNFTHNIFGSSSNGRISEAISFASFSSSWVTLPLMSSFLSFSKNILKRSYSLGKTMISTSPVISSIVKNAMIWFVLVVFTVTPVTRPATTASSLSATAGSSPSSPASYVPASVLSANEKSTAYLVTLFFKNDMSSSRG